MTSIRRVREQVQRLAGRLTGTRPEVPAFFRVQVDSIGKYSEIRALPVRAAEPIQILDTSDDNFGDFWFMPGFDAPGSKPLKPS